MAEKDSFDIAAYLCGTCILGPNCDNRCNDALNFEQGKTEVPYEGENCDRYENMLEEMNRPHDIDDDEEIPYNPEEDDDLFRRSIL